MLLAPRLHGRDKTIERLTPAGTSSSLGSTGASISGRALPARLAMPPSKDAPLAPGRAKVRIASAAALRSVACAMTTVASCAWPCPAAMADGVRRSLGGVTNGGGGVTMCPCSEGMGPPRMLAGTGGCGYERRVERSCCTLEAVPKMEPVSSNG